MNMCELQEVDYNNQKWHLPITITNKVFNIVVKYQAYSNL
jgi:hypothetical protein